MIILIYMACFFLEHVQPEKKSMLWLIICIAAPLLFFTLAIRIFVAKHGTAVDRNIFEFMQSQARDLASDMLLGSHGPAQKNEALQLIRTLDFFAARGFKLTDGDKTAMRIMQRFC